MSDVRYDDPLDRAPLREAAELMLAGLSAEPLALLRPWTATHPDDLDGWLLTAWACRGADSAEDRLSSSRALVRLAPGLGAGHFFLSVDPSAATVWGEAEARYADLVPEHGIMTGTRSLVWHGAPSPLRDALPPVPPAPVFLEYLPARLLSGYQLDGHRVLAFDARAWTQLDPSSARAWWTLAISLMDLGQHRAAAGAARRLVDLAPDDEGARQLLDAARSAVAAPAEQRHASSPVGAPEPAPAPDPEPDSEPDSEPLVAAAWEALEAGDPMRAGELLEQRVAEAPTDAPAWKALACARHVARDEAAAVAAAQAAVDLAPDDPDARWLRLDLHASASDAERITLLEELIAAAPWVRSPYVDLSALHRRAGDLDRALDVAERGAWLAPAPESARFVWPAPADQEPPPSRWITVTVARCLAVVEQREWLVVLVLSRTWLQLEPGCASASPLLLRASALIELEHPEQAVPLLRRATAVDPASADSWLSLAVALQESEGDRDEQVAAARRARELDPTTSRSARRLVRAARRRPRTGGG